MSKFTMILFAGLCGLSQSVAWAQLSGKYFKTNKAFADSLKGKTKWLKTEVIRLEKGLLENVDVTHVDTIGVYYGSGTDLFGPKAPRWNSADEFVDEHRSRSRTFTIIRWPKETKVTIHKLNFYEKNADLGITNPTGNKSTIHLDFYKTDYMPEDVKRLLKFALADSTGELAAQPVKLELGMSIDAVIKLKRQPKTRADLGSKTVLTYDDVKIIFIDGKLTDVQ